ncbi:MAG TPA: phosphopyruvate hydratase [Chloroflexota bacterium]|nr:phosphopyruvate hydratase [Chloroflexota bacterium]
MSDRFQIIEVAARQILDSRGNPTVEADVKLAGGVVGRASVPSGASTGRHEAAESRDTGSPAWAGRGVLGAVRNLRDVCGPAVLGLDARHQAGVDQALAAADGTENLGRLGANAILAVSLATARAAAGGEDRPLYAYLADLAGSAPILPLPMVNMISGGAHAGRNLDIQDVLAVPVGAPTYVAALEMVTRVYWALRDLLVRDGYPPLVGDEGGFGPSLAGNEEALVMVTRAIEHSGLLPGTDVSLALDVASSRFFQNGLYHLAHGEGGPRVLDADGMTDLMEGWLRRYPLIAIEDPLAEDDWDGWRQLSVRLGHQACLIGDDLFVTDAHRLRIGIEAGIANSVLIKANQIGTLTLTLETLQVARAHRYGAVISARSGETEDDWLADLAVGSGAGWIKVGSVARSERLAKYNRLLRIEEGAADMPYAGGPGGFSYT